jgi:hypothetical protein
MIRPALDHGADDLDYFSNAAECDTALLACEKLSRINPDALESALPKAKDPEVVKFLEAHKAKCTKDQGWLRQAALKSPHKTARMTAISRLEDPDVLEMIAASDPDEDMRRCALNLDRDFPALRSSALLGCFLDQRNSLDLRLRILRRLERREEDYSNNIMPIFSNEYLDKELELRAAIYLCTRKSPRPESIKRLADIAISRSHLYSPLNNEICAILGRIKSKDSIDALGRLLPSRALAEPAAKALTSAYISSDPKLRRHISRLGKATFSHDDQGDRDRSCHWDSKGFMFDPKSLAFPSYPTLK